jgi:hypothetical protein
LPSELALDRRPAMSRGSALGVVRCSPLVNHRRFQATY